MIKAALLAGALVLSFSSMVFAQSADTADTIIVLDASNSMWGQINGVSKIEIAREVISDLVTGFNPATRVGLVAYGHRRKSDCRDIELVLPVAPLDAASFSAAVNNLTPRGRTPLTEAVRQAAEALNYRDSAGRVILVSDGLESCNATPCTLARALAKNGVDFTVHVIGFDVAGIEDQSQLSCLATQTGGLYLTADSTQELSTALNTIIEAEASPPVAPVPPEFSVLLRAPAEVFAGAVFETSWQAAARAGDVVVLLPEKGNPEAPLARMDATAGSPAEFTAPGVGRYRLAYLDGQNTLLSSVELTVVQNVEVRGPERAIAGAEIEVAWEGPGDVRDYITVVPLGARNGEYNRYVYASEASPARLLTPDEAGAFEIRYVSASSQTVLARQPIGLLAPTVSLDALDIAPAGAPLDIRWEGPNNERDFITIVAPDARIGAYNDYAYTSAGSPATITAPDQPGNFEVRYVSGQSNTTLASRLITLEPVDVSLEALDRASAGASIAITWKGPNAARDFITIVEPGAREGAYGGYAYTKDGPTLQVQAPDLPGLYEIRYVSGQSNSTLAQIPLRLAAPTVLLAAPSPVRAGVAVSVEWLGPDNKRDYISIAEVGAQDRAYLSYAYTREGSPLALTAPDTAGTYELRYVSGQSDRVLETVLLIVGGT